MHNPNEIVTTKTLNTPCEIVYTAWTNPAILKLWWGPAGFTNTFHEFNLQPGGYWRFTMHSPDGVDFNNESLFHEIIPNKRITWEHISGHRFNVEVTFEAQAEKTTVSFKMIFPTVEECEKLKPIIIPSNDQNFARLESELAKIMQTTA